MMSWFWSAVHALDFFFDLDKGIGQWTIPILAGWVFGETAKRFAKLAGYDTPLVPWITSIVSAGVFAFVLDQQWDELPKLLEVPLIAVSSPLAYTLFRNILRVLPFKWSTYLYTALKGRSKITESHE